MKIAIGGTGLAPTREQKQHQLHTRLQRRLLKRHRAIKVVHAMLSNFERNIVVLYTIGEIFSPKHTPPPSPWPVDSKITFLKTFIPFFEACLVFVGSEA